jgi:hypothetical protein
MSLEYRLKEPIQLDLSPYDIEGKACTWYDFEHPMHRMPPFDQVFSYY